ncbi:MAG: hypothetical protein A2636_07090 [Elusimicrobia bacterium RIFCSPHIGHO2_01_FULL_64_10]|nr:MAG: hypothetical protein A2636_07090 [Elusimicrobia bacterium RIFCSPHIGHO2_01_FULL_64_10]
MRVLAPGYVTAALADDGTIEAIENPGRQEILAVQWHPERTPDSRATRRLFQWFVKTCREARGTKKR